MKLPEFVFINHSDIVGKELILSTVSPYYIGRVLKFESAEAMEDFSIKHNVILDSEQVPGYNILLCYMGNIEGINEKIVLGHNVPKEAKPFLKQAAHFYEKERIKGNETRLKKYRR